jgi:hypothetical protein
MLLQPKNWAVFQHYKDRCPPWIKLHRDLLNDRAYMSLPVASKAIAPLLWLLASESKDGVFDGSPDELVFRLHMTTKEVKDGVKPLIEKGFFTVASGVLAEGKQTAIPETETEGETKKEKEEKKEKKATIVACPLDVSPRVWDDWLALRKKKNAPVTQTVVEGAKIEAEKLKWSLEKFLIEWCTRGSQGLKAEWILPKASFAQQAADIVRTTVPASNEPDPALEKIKADAKTTRPPTLAELARMAELRKKA